MKGAARLGPFQEGFFRSTSQSQLFYTQPPAERSDHPHSGRLGTWTSRWLSPPHPHQGTRRSKKTGQ